MYEHKPLKRREITGKIIRDSLAGMKNKTDRNFLLPDAIPCLIFRGCLWGAADNGGNGALEEHRLATLGTDDFLFVPGRVGFIGCLGRLLWFELRANALAQRLLQSHQAGTNSCAKETKVAHFHKPMRKHMLKETLDETLHRKRAELELTRVGSAILKSDLGRFHVTAMVNGDQAAVANGNPVNVRGQILECCLPISNWFAMHHPILHPDFGSDLCKKSCFLQPAPKSGAK